MNLCFYAKNGSHVDFPFQTPSTLTYDVLELMAVPDQLNLIRKHLEARKWDETDINNTMDEVAILLNDPDLHLTMV